MSTTSGSGPFKHTFFHCLGTPSLRPMGFRTDLVGRSAWVTAIESGDDTHEGLVHDGKSWHHFLVRAACQRRIPDRCPAPKGLIHVREGPLGDLGVLVTGLRLVFQSQEYIPSLDIHGKLLVHEVIQDEQVRSKPFLDCQSDVRSTKI